MLLAPSSSLTRLIGTSVTLAGLAAGCAGPSVIPASRSLTLPPPVALGTEAVANPIQPCQFSVVVAADDPTALQPATSDPPPAPRATPSDGPEPENSPSRNTSSTKAIKPIGQVTLNIGLPRPLDATAAATRPDEPAMHEGEGRAPEFPRDYAANGGHGMAEGFYTPSLKSLYQPLYFEETKLERYGHTAGILQPGLSAARFYGTIPLLPVKMILHRPWQCFGNPHCDLPSAEINFSCRYLEDACVPRHGHRPGCNVP